MRYENCDLTQKSGIENFLDKNTNLEIKTILHCATSARVGTDYPVNTLTNNVAMLVNLLDICTKRQISLINLGSGSDIDRKRWDIGMPEDYHTLYPPETTDVHGYSKYIISRIISNSNYNNVLNLRLYGVFGEGENYRYKFISNTIAKVLCEQEIIIVRDRLYNYIHVDEIGRFIAYLDSSADNISLKYNDINFCDTSPISLVAIANYIAKKIDTGVNVNTLNSGLGLGYGGNTERFRNLFPLFAMSNIYDGIDRLIDYYRERIDSLSLVDLINDKYLDYAKKISR